VSEQTALYRLFAAGDVLLYIGIAKRFGRRWEQHARSQPWWPEVVRQTVDWYPDREAAEDAEKAAIKAENPRHNVMHAPRQDVEFVTNALERDLISATILYRITGADLEKARKASADAVLAALRDGVAPTTVTEKSPFTATYVRQMAREAGIPAPATRRPPSRRRATT
jgi:predicted GIY-YIG superfamily endonuclease